MVCAASAWHSVSNIIITDIQVHLSQLYTQLRSFQYLFPKLVIQLHLEGAMWQQPLLIAAGCKTEEWC